MGVMTVPVEKGNWDFKLSETRRDIQEPCFTSECGGILLYSSVAAAFWALEFTSWSTTTSGCSPPSHWAMCSSSWDPLSWCLPSWAAWAPSRRTSACLCRWVPHSRCDVLRLQARCFLAANLRAQENHRDIGLALQVSQVCVDQQNFVSDWVSKDRW